MVDARTYFITFGVGLLVGAIYATLNVRSPAPPIIALIGLLGILLGEQIVPIAKRWLSGEAVSRAEMTAQCAEPIFGQLPQSTQIDREV